MERLTMTTRNDITGDEIKTKGVSDSYRDNFDKIFGKPKGLGMSEEDRQILDKLLETKKNNLKITDNV
jgi:hypothetical protein